MRPRRAASLPAAGIEEVTNLSSVPMASKLLTDVMRTRPPIRSAASLPGMRIDPGNSPAVTVCSASSGNRWTSCSIRARRSSTAAGTEAAGGFSRSSASSLRDASARVLVSSSFRRRSAISRPCSSSSRFCSAKSRRSSSSDAASAAVSWPNAGPGPKPRHATRARIDRRVAEELGCGHGFHHFQGGGRGIRRRGSTDRALSRRKALAVRNRSVAGAGRSAR